MPNSVGAQGNSFELLAELPLGRRSFVLFNCVEQNAFRFWLQRAARAHSSLGIEGIQGEQRNISRGYRRKGIGSNGGVIAQSVSQDNAATQTSPVESSALLRPVSHLPQRGLPCGELSGTQRL